MEVESVTNGQLFHSNLTWSIEALINPKEHISVTFATSENMEVWGRGALGEGVEV